MDQIEAFCDRHGLKWLALFGSVLRDDFDPQQSDIDILVDFEPGRVVGFLSFAGYAIELEKMLGGEVDLRTPDDLSPYFRDRVINASETLYGAR